jgi:hypothetical protein
VATVTGGEEQTALLHPFWILPCPKVTTMDSRQQEKRDKAADEVAAWLMHGVKKLMADAGKVEAVMVGKRPASPSSDVEESPSKKSRDKSTMTHPRTTNSDACVDYCNQKDAVLQGIDRGNLLVERVSSRDKGT